MSTIDDLVSSSTGIAGGPYTQIAQDLLSRHLDGSEVRLTTSGTDALEVAGILAEFVEGDTALVPSFGFVTTALAFVRAGARIRFVDIDEETLGMDPDDLDRKMDDTVRAVVPIHYAGIPCQIEEIQAVVSRWERMLLIEDNAHGLFGTVNGRPLGTFGALSCLSFHGTKNVSCGEGGAIVLNDGDLLERAEVVLEKGTDRQQYLRGQVDKYTWRDIGSSFGLSDYLAAILVEQLQQVDEIQRRRGELFNRYVDLLSPRCEELRLRLPFVESGHQPAHHLFYVLLSNADARDTLLSRMRDAGVGASFHYPPLHQSPGGRTWGDGATARCPTSEKVAASIVRLPLDHRMSESVVDQAVEVFLSSLANLRGA